ncbi:hypothetical protein N0V84_003842 [Fusarium piperis]|uniref:Uncharacterized protein n=1 Tax=Fusarium piperis TaxID=1435070 RepID=A0A9W9BRS3_9HYPO|nr:hypothetical protein N0V84_003842 [Fusarium piperis]
MLWLGAAAYISVAIVALMFGGYHSRGKGEASGVKLPEHLVSHDVGSYNEPEHHICVAYEALFQLEPKYHTSPPNFYKLLNVPLTSPVLADDSNNDSDQDARLRIIMARLEGKMHKLFSERRSLPQGPGRDKVVKAISAWNKIGLVLLNHSIRDVYAQKFGENDVGKVLMKMCGERWEKQT